MGVIIKMAKSCVATTCYLNPWSYLSIIRHVLTTCARGNWIYIDYSPSYPAVLSRLRFCDSTDASVTTSYPLLAKWAAGCMAESTEISLWDGGPYTPLGLSGLDPARSGPSEGFRVSTRVPIGQLESGGPHAHRHTLRSYL
jgi:hypothetical protein